MQYFIIENYHNNNPVKMITYPLNTCIISNEIAMGNIWEKHMHEIFEKYINKDSIVLEGGCHIGTHTLKLAYLSNHVYAFEPMQESYEILCNNFLLNKLSNITIYKYGLSNSIGKTHFQWMTKYNPGGSGLANNPLGTIPSIINDLKENQVIDVELITIDSLNLDKLDFIKLDIEGYEEYAIEGGIETIKRCKPIITIENWVDLTNDVVDINNVKTKFKNLLDLGYQLEHIYGPDYLFLPPKN